MNQNENYQGTSNAFQDSGVQMKHVMSEKKLVEPSSDIDMGQFARETDGNFIFCMLSIENNRCRSQHCHLASPCFQARSILILEQ